MERTRNENGEGSVADGKKVSNHGRRKVINKFKKKCSEADVSKSRGGNYNFKNIAYHTVCKVSLCTGTEFTSELFDV